LEKRNHSISDGSLGPIHGMFANSAAMPSEVGRALGWTLLPRWLSQIRQFQHQVFHITIFACGCFQMPYGAATKHTVDFEVTFSGH